MIKIQSPGRICLFGEHQDYLNLPVIAMAISRYIYLEAERISSPQFIIELPDLDETLEISLNNRELEYDSKRDYLKSGYNLFLRKGIKFNKGYKIKITGDIPINAGVASSSALVIAWLYFLNQISGETINKKSNLAIEGYNTEVKEFNEAGGMMDHYSSIYGNLIYLEPKFPRPNFISINEKIDGFVLGNSLEKKDTVENLMKVKILALNAFKALKESLPTFDQYKTSLEEVKPFLPNLEKQYQKKVVGNLINRDITVKAKKLIFEDIPCENTKVKDFYQQLGNLLNMHHIQLKNNIGIYTEKIELMIKKCLESGALGAKINGSGFGGTMFALSIPGNEIPLKNAIEDAEGKAYMIKTSNGVEKY